jgi:predicted CoA-substrate-specific enzyme activase
MDYFLGIDAGSVSTKLVMSDVAGNIVASSYLPTCGLPLEAVAAGLNKISSKCSHSPAAIAVTGSGRELVSNIVHSSLLKNEITAQARAAVHLLPDVQTVIEIGGQDSKLILIRGGLVSDFGMNTVCAAGTGSFLDHQSTRLRLEADEFGRKAVDSQKPVSISGRCTVFAESDMIHLQQTGTPIEDIVYGLCKNLVRNYLASVAAGRMLLPPVLFQGGVARNPGMVRALEEELGVHLVIPPSPELTGALGAALLARDEITVPASSRPKNL